MQAVVPVRTLSDHLAEATRRSSPAWFTSVMGTGIFAIGLQLAPVALPGFRAAAMAIFLADVVLFAGFAALLVRRLVSDRSALEATLADSAVAQTWGAPPMAAFTIAVGFLTIAPGGANAALCIATAQILFAIGAVLSLFCVAVVPFRMFTSHELVPHGAVGSWLLPVVPPIVASVPAALLSPTWPAAARSSILALAYGSLGVGIALAAVLIVIFYSRMLFAKVPEAALVTTTWLVVGPLGQSVAGAIALGAAAKTVWPQFGGALALAGVAYGLLVWGVGVYWLGMAIALTVRATRRGLPFTLGWWAFTFPVGTLMSASYALSRTTGAVVFEIAGFALLALLGAMWVLVATRSVRHGLAHLASAT